MNLEHPFVITLLVLCLITSVVGNIVQALSRQRIRRDAEVDALMRAMQEPMHVKRARKILRRM